MLSVMVVVMVEYMVTITNSEGYGGTGEGGCDGGGNG